MSQKAEHQDADQSQARAYTHQEGMAMTRQHELYHRCHPCHENTGHQLTWPCGQHTPQVLLLWISSYQFIYTTCDHRRHFSPVEKSYLGAIQRVFMYKCLHKLLRSNVT